MPKDPAFVLRFFLVVPFFCETSSAQVKTRLIRLFGVSRSTSVLPASRIIFSISAESCPGLWEFRPMNDPLFNDCSMESSAPNRRAIFATEGVTLPNKL